MAATPEASEHNSIRERIAPRFELAQAVREQMRMGALLRFDGPVKPRLTFEGAFADREHPGIPLMTPPAKLPAHEGQDCPDNLQHSVPAAQEDGNFWVSS